MELKSKHFKSNSTVRPQTEDVSNQIDRLNYALEEVIHQIELSSTSRNPSRQSFITSELFNDDTVMSDDSISISPEYNSTIENLFQSLDRQQMIIEDYRSEEIRKPEKSAFEDLERIKKEVWSELRMQQRDQIDREHKNLDEKLKAVEGLRQEYMSKRLEINGIMQKLTHKEQLLTEKEAEIRAQRLNLEKNKMDWETKHGNTKKTEPVTVNRGHARANSYSFFSSSRGQSINPAESGEDLQEKLKSLQNALKTVQIELETCKNSQKSEKELKIESLKNKIATVRGEIAINEANKGSEIIGFMMESLQKEASREEKMKRVELVQAANKSMKQYKPPLVPSKLNLTEKYENKGKSGLGFGKSAGKKENDSGVEKIKEREKLLMRTWIRLPVAKELVENANSALIKLGMGVETNVEKV